MKLWYVCQVNLNSQHAEAVHVKEVVKNLIDEGVQVTLFAPKQDGQVNLPCELVEIDFNKTAKGYLSFQYKLLKLMRRHISGSKPDIIYVRHSALMVAPYLFGWRKQIRTFVEINGLFVDEVKDLHNVSNSMVSLVGYLEKFALSKSYKVVAVTKGLKDFLVEKYHLSNDKVAVIENGANTDLFRPINKAEALEITGLSKENLYLGFVGNIAPWQGLINLIEAFRIIGHKYPELKAVIVGDGPSKRELEKKINEYSLEESFVFTGSVPYEEVPYYINSFNMTVAPFNAGRNSKIGISPLKIYEYLACGKPVIASRIKGIDKLIEDNELGYLVDPDCPQSLAKAIEKAIQEHKEFPSERLRELIVNHYSWKAVAQKIVLLSSVKDI